MVRQAHGPEQRRRVNLNFQYQMTKRFKYQILELVGIGFLGSRSSKAVTRNPQIVLRNAHRVTETRSAGALLRKLNAYSTL
jgi:hypothetical protein